MLLPLLDHLDHLDRLVSKIPQRDLRDHRDRNLKIIERWPDRTFLLHQHWGGEPVHEMRWLEERIVKAALEKTVLDVAFAIQELAELGLNDR